MSTNSKKERFQFWRKWVVLNALALIIAYVVGLTIGFIFLANPGYEWVTHFEQSRDVILIYTAMGLIIGTIQWLLLRRRYKVSLLWIWAYPIAVIVVEIIACFITWKLDINRGDLSFIQGDPYSHAIILAITGLLIGLIQVQLLKKHFSKTFFWILASSLAWAISVLITAIGHKYDTVLAITFILGTLLYGAITGTTLTSLLKPKNIKP